MKSKTGKTNKSYAKRLKITRSGKALRRSGGQNHFNAKQSRSKQMSQKGLSEFVLSSNDLGHYLPRA